MDHLIMVSPRNHLFAEREFNGFCRASDYDYSSRVLSLYEWMRRRNAEEHMQYKQPIPSVVVVNVRDQTVFSTRRTTTSNESRLHGAWSCIIGGHVEPEDANASANPLFASCIREVEEELEISDYPQPMIFGYISDDSRPVDRVHLGIIYVISLDHGNCRLADQTLSEGAFRTIDDLEGLINSSGSPEVWTQHLLNPLREYFQALQTTKV